MYGQGNYSSQVGQDPYARAPAFQQHPATVPPPSTPLYTTLSQQHPHIQHGNPSFHPTYHGGMSSAQSYIHRPIPSHISSQVSNSYPTIEQQPLPWSGNVHELRPPAPLQGQSAYQLPSSQGYTLERGPRHQHPLHAPPPPLPPSYRPLMGPMLPPPPPPPPRSPPRDPPLPVSSPSSVVLSNNEGNLSWKGLLPDGNKLALECPPPGKPADDSSVNEKVHFHTETGTNVGPVNADAANSPSDSDMDMEDDITYPDEEKNNCLSANSNEEYGSMTQEEYTGEKLQNLQCAGGHRLPEMSVHGNLSCTEASVAEVEVEGSEVASDCNFLVTKKVSSKAESGMRENGQDGNSLDASIKESPSWQKNFGQSESLGDVGLITKSDVEKEHEFGSDLRSDKKLLPESFTRSPRNLMEDDKLVAPIGMEGFADRSHRGQEPISSGTHTASQPKDSSRYYGENIGIQEANAHKPDMKSDKLKVDEFGRLIREDVSDNRTNDSPTYARRHGRRARKRSQSRSRSPRDSRRRRSPRRRKERRGRSRSLSPRRRNRTRSPVSRYDTEFGGDKLRREKGRHPGCFDFLRGKCYHGANCRFSHHESHKSERSRYNRGKQHYQDAPPTLRSPDIHEEAIKDKSHRLYEDIPSLRELKDAKSLRLGSTRQSPDKIDNISEYPVHETPSGKHNYFIPESAAKYSDKITQVVDQQGERADDSMLSESSSLAQALAGTPTHHRADEHNSRQDPSSHMYSLESHSTRSYPNKEVPSQPLKELLPSVVDYPSASQLASASFAQPIFQGYSSNPPISQNHFTPGNYSTYEASVPYQHYRFPGPLKSLSSLILPSLPPLPPPSAEHRIPPEHLQRSSLPSWNGLSSYTSVRNQPTEKPSYRYQTGEYQAYSLAREPDQTLHDTDGFGSSSLHTINLTSREGGPHMVGKDLLAGDQVWGINYSKSFSQVQTNPLLRQSPFKEMCNSLGAGLSSESNSSYDHSYFQQASHGLQYYAAGDVLAKVSELGTTSSSFSSFTQDLLERNRPCVYDLGRSRISNHSSHYMSSFDLPLDSKYSSNALVRENDADKSIAYGAPVGSSSIPVDPYRVRNVGVKNMISSSSKLPAEFVSRSGGNQYDPLFDSIEPISNSFNKVAHLKHETTGDSDDVLRFHASGRLLNTEAVKREGETTVSSNDSVEKEECGVTADMVEGAVLNGTPSDPNDAIDMNAGEFEIDQVKTSGKKKKRKERSSSHFKISVAAFVKQVLKPSWRQGNMSKEAFKTIVKKTVDKVSRAMKSHQMPKSDAKIKHYIDSSRGKLTKLVMGYVDKYVKV